MALPSQREAEDTRARLCGWLATKVNGATDVSVSEIGGPAYNGYSHETLMFDASWTGEGRFERRRLVARVEPSSHSIFFTQDVGLEARVMRAMADAGVAAPRVHWHEPDPGVLGAPFIVMDRVDGAIPPDNPPYTFGGWLSEASPEQQARVWWSGLEAMAAVHRVDPAGLGYLARPKGEPGADAELLDASAYIDRVVGDQRHATMDRALGWLDAHRPATPEPLRVCWGDSRIGNQIFDDFRCAALLDWEMAVLGNPEQDLAWFLYFDRLFSDGLSAPRPAGFPGRPETLSRYEELTGIRPRSIEFYEVLASLRFAVILMRLGQLMVWNGQLPEDTDFGTNSFAVLFLANLLDEEGA